jgi:hypothetical protein
MEELIHVVFKAALVFSNLHKALRQEILRQRRNVMLKRKGLQLRKQLLKRQLKRQQQRNEGLKLVLFKHMHLLLFIYDKSLRKLISIYKHFFFSLVRDWS